MGMGEWTEFVNEMYFGWDGGEFGILHEARKGGGKGRNIYILFKHILRFYFFQPSMNKYRPFGIEILISRPPLFPSISLLLFTSRLPSPLSPLLSPVLIYPLFSPSFFLSPSFPPSIPRSQFFPFSPLPSSLPSFPPSIPRPLIFPPSFSLSLPSYTPPTPLPPRGPNQHRRNRPKLIHLISPSHPSNQPKSSPIHLINPSQVHPSNQPKPSS